MMAGRRIVGILILLLVVIVAVCVIWYIGGQKTVYDAMLSLYS